MKKRAYKPNERIKLPDGANPIDFNGPRDADCPHHKICLEYILQKNEHSLYFSCVYCEKASKSIQNSKPVKSKNMNSVKSNIQKKKPTITNFELPDGANPIHVNGLVDIFCGSYKDCRKYIRRAHKDWLYFSCIECPKSSINAQGLNSDTNVKYIADGVK